MCNHHENDPAADSAPQDDAEDGGALAQEEHEMGRDAFDNEDDYRLHCLRHSAAHVLAQAILQLWPDARLAFGPAIKDGFYYDVDIPGVTLSETDLEAIEAEMKKVVKENQPFEQEDWTKEQAVAYFAEKGQVFKVEHIGRLPVEKVSIYRNRRKDGGEFVDLCGGPHVMRTKQAKNVKLLKVSGAYWLGDAKNPQLQRVYGTVWKTKEELDQYLFRLEEAKKRDHRKLGAQLDLFMFHDWAPGAPFWLPRGEFIYDLLGSRMRKLLAGSGYDVVKTPLVFDKKLFETSGHWDHYQENLFHFPEGHFLEGDADELEGTDQRILGLKPMNCPSHMLIFRSRKRSYRELPLRIHDQGVLHRNELSGALSGLTRVRQFSQDDGHLFCAEDQIADEVAALLELIDRVYAAFGMKVEVNLATRPEKMLGDDALWDRAEGALQEALDRSGRSYGIHKGDGAFYGPKIDFDVYDALGRSHQCATVQLDYNLPIRFDLTYVGADNELHRPVVVHRAVFGSFERFVGILIEHYAGKFPVWMCPEQVRVMTVSEKSLDHGASVTKALSDAGVRVHFDDGDSKIGYKIRQCHGMLVPYMAVIGEQELADGTVSIRSRDDGDLGTMTVEDFVAKVVSESVLPF
ncbi:MAG: threonine--tRNA ligase [Alphaproteobacteria bacterium]|nr:threonine--tRNA ligase [Alphaproteobacteria bacterium]